MSCIITAFVCLFLFCFVLFLFLFCFCFCFVVVVVVLFCFILCFKFFCHESTDPLYNVFYCPEPLTVGCLDEQICSICGLFGEVYLGDRNQKNSRSVKEVHI